MSNLQPEMFKYWFLQGDKNEEESLKQSVGKIISSDSF